ncbi:GNAT family N-acetyltransferase, partial [Candidatus Woesearchaeota archaeon]|nr:GNAT family N-acetyltransferase [Candidatus Woesearchaeota archaeon]
MKLTTKRLILRDLEKKDLESLVKNVNNLNVSKYLSVVPYPYKKKDGEWFINHARGKAKQKPRVDYDFGIALKEENKIIGIIGLTKIDRFQGTATIGYWLGEKYWRQGIMTEAAKRVLDYAFKTLKLRRINICAYTKNKASQALIKKLGFKYEG